MTSGTGTCTVNFNQAGDLGWNSAPQVTETITANKAIPNVTAWPTASGITHGQALSDSTLSGGTASANGNSVSGNFVFTDSSIVPDIGTYSASVTFTPTDATSYITPPPGNIDVTVAPNAADIEAVTEANAETAVAAYESGPLDTLEETATAERLKSAADDATALVLNGAAHDAFVARISTRADAIISAMAALEAEAKFAADHAVADPVTAQIDALPLTDALTLDDKAAVDSASAAFDALTLDQKALVPNSTLLATDISKITNLQAAADKLAADHAAADPITAQIDALPAVEALVLDAASAVSATRAAYNLLTADQQALVTNSTTLEAAEAQIDVLQAAQDAADKLAADVAALDTAISAAGALTSTNYTIASWGALAEALALPATTNAEIITKTTAVNDAISRLVLSISGATLPLTTIDNGDGSFSGTVSGASEVSTTSNDIIVTLDIPAGTVITGPSTWNDTTLTLPTATTTYTAPPTSSGFNPPSVVTAIEIGAGDMHLVFSNPVELTFVGQGGNGYLVGWSQAGTFRQIKATCDSAGSSTVGGVPLASDSDCMFDSGVTGSDLIVWTTHFSTFITYTQTAIPTQTTTTSTGGGGGGGRGNSISPIAVVTTPTTPAVGQVLGAAAYNFTKNLGVGLRGADVTALQQFLIDGGFSIPAGATGYFGMQTKLAVIAYQKANNLPATGYVGPLTLALLNKGEVPVAESSGLSVGQASAIVGILQVFDADAATIAKVKAALGL